MNKQLIGKIIFLLIIVQVFGKKLNSQKSLINNKSQQQRDFQKFKKTYNKSYESNELESYRFNVFLENIKQADRLNNENPSAQYGITQFSDYTIEEFLSLYANVKPPSQVDIFDSYVQNTSGAEETLVNLPQQWDIRVNGPGQLQQVKATGQCFCDCAFSATSTVENLYSFQQNQTLNLSEQQLVDCNYRSQGCNGGWFTDAYDYVKYTGLATSSRYPYIGMKGVCREQQVGQLYKIKGYKNLPKDQNSIKQALITNGAISVAVDGSNWGSYIRGIYKASPPFQINKGVTIIGYGPNYWLLRNNWGTIWGEMGHIRVANDGTGGIFLENAFQPNL
ncbi:hypothetical protein ABPG74_009314 [Tetrahymena malaccensis]